ncbi:MAG: RsmD family RNA methyltransferase [Opitutae bacterium]|nr:RsmD family RNA methyltransferase [Opitutae bacterium]
MRISGGTARGITLRVPPGDAVRPATDGMRQAVFSSLAARVPGARFCDLFAGSGAYGLEALSRGAAGGVFVEKNAKAVACVRTNLAAVCKSLGRDERGVTVLPVDVLTAPLAAQPAVDLVFIDPPYEIIAEVAPALFARLAEWLVPPADPVVVFEMPGELTLTPPGWQCVKRLGKGAHQPTVCFFRRADS